jgi:hypothetical protein
MFNGFSRSESSHHHQQHVALLATAVALYFEQRKTHLAGKKHGALLQEASSSLESQS